MKQQHKDSISNSQKDSKQQKGLQRVFMESSSSKTLWPETCEVGHIWTTVWLGKKTSKELMSIYGKVKVKNSLDRNLLSRSNMDHCLSGKKKH